MQNKEKKSTLRAPVGQEQRIVVNPKEMDTMLEQEALEHEQDAFNSIQQTREDGRSIQIREGGSAEKSKVMSQATRRLTIKASGDEKKNASETINLQHIMELREAFEEADTDQGGSLELPEFTNAFGDVLGKGMTPKQIEQLFWKIDANSDGTVDWNEFMNYMLLENETLSSMKAEHFEYVKFQKPDPPPGKMDSHHDMIQQIFPFQDQQAKTTRKYLTAGRDGVLKMWNGNSQGMQNTNSINIGSSWITAITAMYLSERLVVASANRTVSFFDLNQSNITNPCSKISDMDGVPLCLDYFSKTGEGRKEVLIIGDDLGIIHLYNFEPGWHICDWRIRSHNAMNCEEHSNIIERRQQDFISQRLEVTTNQKQVFDKDYLNRKIDRHYKKNVTVMKCVIHRSWITKVKYVDDVSSLISCGLDGFIHFHQLEKLKYRRSFKLHQKGVNSFVWCASNRFMASCGEERHIILWNAYTTKAIAYLYGHNTSVQELCINEDRNHLISLGTDKVVKIWDIRTYRCVQTLVDKFSYRPEDRLTCMIYDSKINAILLGSRKINIWQFKTQETIPTSHEFPICAALFNEKFDTVIACDDGSNVLVWDAEKGKLMSKFAEAHDKKKITAASFDESQRRIITTATDGSVKIWNFSNGQLLSIMKHIDSCEVTSAIYVGENEKNKLPYIATAGWNRKICIWPDDKEEFTSTSKILPLQNHKGHDDDVMSLAYSGDQNLLFSGGHDGSLIAWSFETGFPKVFMHWKDQKMVHRDPAYHAKSVDNLLILKEKKTLISSTSDQLLRFWNLKSLNLILSISAGHGVANHPSQEAITALGTSSNNNFILTGDTSGNLKLHDISDLDLQAKEKIQSSHASIYTNWFIRAHFKTINHIEVIENMYPGRRFILTAGDDRNIMLHTWQGIAVGYFGQHKGWSISTIDKLIEGKERKEPNVYLGGKKKQKKLRFADDEENEVKEDDIEQGSESEGEQEEETVFHAQEYLRKDHKVDVAYQQSGSQFLNKFREDPSGKKAWFQSAFDNIDIGAYKPVYVPSSTKQLHSDLTGKRQKWFVDELKVQTSFFKFKK